MACMVTICAGMFGFQCHAAPSKKVCVWERQLYVYIYIYIYIYIDSARGNVTHTHTHMCAGGSLCAHGSASAGDLFGVCV